MSKRLVLLSVAGGGVGMGLSLTAGKEASTWEQHGFMGTVG